MKKLYTASQVITICRAAYKLLIARNQEVNSRTLDRAVKEILKAVDNL